MSAESDRLEQQSANRSPAGGWSGEGSPEHGNFYRPKRGYVHIAVDVREDAVIVAACGRSHYVSRSEPASGDEADQCAECWEAM